MQIQDSMQGIATQVKCVAFAMMNWGFFIFGFVLGLREHPGFALGVGVMEISPFTDTV